MIVTCDSNVLISAFLFPGGKPDKIFRSISSGRFQHATSPDILREVTRVLEWKFKLTRVRVDVISHLIGQNSQLVTPSKRLSIVKADPSDNRILECAVKARSDYLITGDKKHLIPLKRFEGITILTPSEFARVFKII